MYIVQQTKNDTYYPQARRFFVRALASPAIHTGPKLLPTTRHLNLIWVLMWQK